MIYILSKDCSPIHPLTGLPHDSADPSTHLTLDQAQKMSRQWSCEYGVLMVPPYFCVDIDHHSEEGKWSQLSMDIVGMFPGAYVEVSRSGDGIHIIGSYSKPFTHKCKNIPLRLELYTHYKVITLTGDRAIGDWNTTHDDSIDQIVDLYFQPKEKTSFLDWTTEPVPEFTGDFDDEELIQKALKSKSNAATFGSRASFKQLWKNEKEALEKFYGDDRSSIDLALCIHLAFWTGKDCARIERLFNLSALVRDKWTDRETYRIDTIVNACGMCTTVYTKPAHVAPTSEGVRHGFQFMPVDKQIDYFKGHTYIVDQHLIITPVGLEMSPQQYKSYMGGYVFALDSEGDSTSKNAWEVFTESQAFNFPKAWTTCFKPLLPPGTIINNAYNTWTVLDVPCEIGDVTPFLVHLEKLLPNARDREILMSYMAACVQYQGVKFTWWPIIQGVQGNGKTFMAEALIQAIGEKHCHTPRADDVGSKFNAWLRGKTFIFVDEIDVEDKRELLDALKPLIANTRADMQPKGVDQKMGEQCANGMMCMNHKDGYKKTENDRRPCIFFTAQQEKKHLKRDGMTGRYFPDFWKWARNGGFAYITHYLREYKISEEFNPADGCQWAPDTSSATEIKFESFTAIEQELLEFMKSDIVGMCGGWASSLTINRLLEGRRYAKRKIPDMLKNLGYIPHPGLPDGRSTRTIPFDAGKPRIYVRLGHISINITDPMEIIRMFITAQTGIQENNRVGYNQAI